MPSYTYYGYFNGSLYQGDNTVTPGAVWILHMSTGSLVKSYTSILGSSVEASNTDRFGASVGFVGDLDNNGVSDLMIGAPATDDGNPHL